MKNYIHKAVGLRFIYNIPDFGELSLEALHKKSQIRVYNPPTSAPQTEKQASHCLPAPLHKQQSGNQAGCIINPFFFLTPPTLSRVCVCFSHFYFKLWGSNCERTSEGFVIVVSLGECVRPRKRVPPRPLLQNNDERVEEKREGEGKGEGCTEVEDRAGFKTSQNPSNRGTNVFVLKMV